MVLEKTKIIIKYKWKKTEKVTVFVQMIKKKIHIKIFKIGSSNFLHM